MACGGGGGGDNLSRQWCERGEGGGGVYMMPGKYPVLAGRAHAQMAVAAASQGTCHPPPQ